VAERWLGLIATNGVGRSGHRTETDSREKPTTRPLLLIPWALMTSDVTFVGWLIIVKSTCAAVKYEPGLEAARAESKSVVEVSLTLTSRDSFFEIPAAMWMQVRDEAGINSVPLRRGDPHPLILIFIASGKSAGVEPPLPRAAPPFYCRAAHRII